MSDYGVREVSTIRKFGSYVLKMPMPCIHLRLLWTLVGAGRLLGGVRMSVKPSANEEEYFARLEMERRRKAAEERDKRMIAEEREQARALHFMKCPINVD